MARDTFSSNQETYLSWEASQLIFLHLSPAESEKMHNFVIIFFLYSRKQWYHVTYLGEENKSIKLQTLVGKVKLSYLLLLPVFIIEFKINETQRETPIKFLANGNLPVSFFWALKEDTNMHTAKIMSSQVFVRSYSAKEKKPS